MADDPGEPPHDDASVAAGGRRPETVLEASLQTVCQLACTVLGADGASVTLAADGAVATVAATDDFALAINALQHAAHEGPCVETAHGTGSTCVGDLRADDRWPTFGPAAVDLGIRSLLAERLELGPATSGVLTLHSSRAHAFDSLDRSLLQAFSTRAAITIGERLDDPVRSGISPSLASHRQVAMAVGVLMHRHQESAPLALARLRGAGHDTHRALVDLADDVVDLGHLPPPPNPRGPGEGTW